MTKLHLRWSPATKPFGNDESVLSHQSATSVRVENLVTTLNLRKPLSGQELLKALEHAEKNLFHKPHLVIGQPLVKEFVWTDFLNRTHEFTFVWGLVPNKKSQKGKKFRGKSVFCLCMKDEAEELVERVFTQPFKEAIGHIP